MPIQITNRAILKEIDKVKKSGERYLKLIEERQKLNTGLFKLLDEEYGQGKWNDVMLEEKTVVLDDEFRKQVLIAKNPNYGKYEGEIKEVTTDGTTEKLLTKEEIN